MKATKKQGDVTVTLHLTDEEFKELLLEWGGARGKYYKGDMLTEHGAKMMNTAHSLCRLIVHGGEGELTLDD